MKKKSKNVPKWNIFLSHCRFKWRGSFDWWLTPLLDSAVQLLWVCVCVCPFFQPSFLRKTHNIELWWDLLCAVDVSVCAFARPERRFAGAGASKCHGASTCLIVHVSVWVVVHDSHGSAIPLITTAAWKGRLPFIAAVCDRKALSGWQTPPANLISSSFRWRIPGYEQLPKLFENIMEQ